MVADKLKVSLDHEIQEEPLDLVSVNCRICGATTIIGIVENENGEIIEGEHLCAQHLFEKVIYVEDVNEGRRLTTKKAVGETIL